MDLTRRDFIKLIGGGATGAIVFSACGVPDEELYFQSPNKLPEDWRSINEPIERVICDYISGMTDRYASRLHKDLYE